MSFETGVVNTVNGPVSTSMPATRADCVPYMCGFDPTNLDVRMWCSEYGQAAALSCVDPDCAPWKDSVPACSLPPPPPLPPASNPIAAAYIAAAQPAPPPPPPTLTPYNIATPLPDITLALQPLPTLPPCSWWESLNGAIEQHPVIALAVVAAAAFIFWPKGGR
jgi:hypothetical protein